MSNYFQPHSSIANEKFIPERSVLTDCIITLAQGHLNLQLKFQECNEKNGSIVLMSSVIYKVHQCNANLSLGSGKFRTLFLLFFIITWTWLHQIFFLVEIVVAMVTLPM